MFVKVDYKIYTLCNNNYPVDVTKKVDKIFNLMRKIIISNLDLNIEMTGNVADVIEI